MLFISLTFSRQLATHYSINVHWVTWYKTHTDVINVIMLKQKKQLYFCTENFPTQFKNIHAYISGSLTHLPWTFSKVLTFLEGVALIRRYLIRFALMI